MGFRPDVGGDVLKYSLSLGAILSGQELQDFLEQMDEAAAEWLGLGEELLEASHIEVTFEIPD